MALLSGIAGCVLIECEGGYPETFLNIAAALHIPLWDVQRREASLWCRASASDYRRLRPAARRACVRMRVRSKRGLPFWLRRRGIRLGPVVGLIVFFIILQLLSSRIWVIRVAGNDTVTDEDILCVLAPLGVREGAPFDEVDITNLRLTALQKLPELTWLTVNQSGSILTVEVKERTDTEPLADNTPANLVAVCDGVIVSIDAVTGQAMVRPGDAVRSGDLLVSGVMDSTVGPQLKKAAGSVIARTTHSLSVTVPLVEDVTVPGREIRRPRLTVFGWNIPLYASGDLPGDPTEVFTKYPLIANGVPLPVGLSVTRFQYTQTNRITRTAEQALALAEQRLAEAETELRETLTVANRSLQVKTDDGGVTLTAVCTGTQELATSVPIA